MSCISLAVWAWGTCSSGCASCHPSACSNNRISVEGALQLAVGLRENKTLKILKVSSFAMRSLQCVADGLLLL